MPFRVRGPCSADRVEVVHNIVRVAHSSPGGGDAHDLRPDLDQCANFGAQSVKQSTIIILSDEQSAIHSTAQYATAQQRTLKVTADDRHAPPLAHGPTPADSI